jgi:hypothetical protein
VDIQNTESTCTLCSGPITNLATDGRPDIWRHTTDKGRRCDSPTPPYQVEESLPRQTRKVRVRYEELVTYDAEIELEVHAGVTPQELSSYLTDHEDLWLEEVEKHEYSASGRLVLDEYSFFADDAGYLANLADGIEECPKSILKWLTLTCPVCGVQPSADDTEHRNVGYFVAIDCNGVRVVDPDWIGMDGTGWTDWTRVVDASGKAGN